MSSGHTALDSIEAIFQRVIGPRIVEEQAV